jgi:oligopeptide/dipeptide ABC transporter ATP-binding protein
MTPLVSLEGVSVHFPQTGGVAAVLRAVDDVSLTIGRRETLALVGESGSGKTTLGHVVAGLRRPSAGRIAFPGGGAAPRVQMVFQDPFTALDPRMLVADIVAEPLRLTGVGKAERRDRAARMVARVGLSAEAAGRYPHEFSGGQRQRIAIARALVAEPALIVADEPLSALDVSIQSQILNLMRDLQDGRDLATLFISHDLAVVHHLADRVAVLYLGRLMEVAPREALFATPSHPYTRALLDAVPRIGAGRRRRDVLKGEIPSPLSPPTGCVFHTRCPRAQPLCSRERPRLEPAPGRRDQLAACHFKE